MKLCLTFHRKDSKQATLHKQEGNKLFLAQKDKNALRAYTRSMQYAPGQRQKGDEGTHLAVAYGNRSAVLFRLHKYQDCLTDIERALAEGIAKQSKPKLLVRQCLCYARLGQREKAMAAQQAIVSLQHDDDDKTTQYLEREMVKIKQEIESISASLEGPGCDARPSEEAAAHVSYSANSVLVQASSAVEMKVSASQGRFLQATRDIKAGDTLIVERPFAAVLLPPHYDTHCLHCFGALPDNPVGCGQCSGVLYCSEGCRDISWATYHHVECRYQDLLHSVGIAHLSLRIVLTMGLPSLLDFLDRREERESLVPEAIPGVTQEGRYERNYLSVFDLMTHTDDMVIDDLFQYSLTASLLLGILIHSGWFGLRQPPPTGSGSCKNMESDNLTAFLEGGSLFSGGGSSQLCEERVFAVGGALLRHVQQLVCNAHAITALHGTRVSEEGLHLVETQSQVRIATAIYPTASLMNHSCDPTIISSFQKDLLVVKSVKDVDRGGEIFNCYGPHCKRMRRGERQQALKSQYFFDCACQACVDSQDTPLAAQGLRCPECGGTVVLEHEVTVCPSCHAAIDMSSVLSLLESADSHFMAGAKYLELGLHAEALERFQECLKVRSRMMSPDNHDLGQVHDAVAQCLASTGCYKEAADHLAKSVAVTEAVFGAHSVETARELHKMAEVQIHAGRPREALTSATRALDTASKLCCQTDDWVQELLCLKTALTGIIADGHVQ
ncbi:protein-lysine N-methyltransferase SMYD4-like [Babylonia areolata]|uniref:protein-lysine N-methyltransferase SMYD4-like n=1 Tax=Babylonia areolata TaxID=304850 RepID=UPI003FD61A08